MAAARIDISGLLSTQANLYNFALNSPICRYDVKGLVVPLKYVLKWVDLEREVEIGIVSVEEIPKLIDAIMKGHDVAGAFGKTEDLYRFMEWVPDCYQVIGYSVKIYYDGWNFGGDMPPLDLSVIIHFHKEEVYNWGYIVNTF